jgi:hypothetical protein
LRGSDGLAAAVLATGAAAGLLMLLSLFMTIASVDVANTSCRVINDVDPSLADRCALSGFERHSIAFLLLGALALTLAWVAGPGRSRPAALGLAAVGVIALIFALAVDLPVTNDTGTIGRDFEGASASAGWGLWVELLGGALALAAGAIGLLRPRPRPERRPRREGPPRTERPTRAAAPRARAEGPARSARLDRAEGSREKRAPRPSKDAPAPRRGPREDS